MDCLFIHGNYPGQFRHLAPLLAEAGHRVIFLTNRADAKDEAQPGVEIRSHPASWAWPHTHHYLEAARMHSQGQAILRERQLATEGFQPRFYPCGGTGLYKECITQTIHIGYQWYSTRHNTTSLAKFDLDTQLQTGLRNLPILQELECCDVAVYQRNGKNNNLPYQNKLNVIFDGIDRSFFHPQEKSQSDGKASLTLRNRETNETFTVPKGSTLISYATRGMETLRGFPEFMRSLPELLGRDETTYALIAGADRRAYSYEAPSHDGSWKQFLLAELGEQLPLDRILFTGLLDYTDYRALLWRSNLHCYFTRPYVTSWSLFEAAACGARLAVNKSPATQGIAKDESVTWVDLDNQQDLTQKLNHALDHKSNPSQLMPGFDLDTALHQWEGLLNEHFN